MFSKINFKKEIFDTTPDNFQEKAIELFRFQAEHVPVYRDYVAKISKTPLHKIEQLKDIPFLPVSFFKKHQIIASGCRATKVFYSSGTTGNRSRHHVSDILFYDQISQHIFRQFYGSIENTAILGILPSYEENPSSSLIHMVQGFINSSNCKNSQFLSYNHKHIGEVIGKLKGEAEKIIIFGVTYALLEVAERGIDLSGAFIIETGGMKGRGEEKTREEVHELLMKGLNVNHVHSEYGMTELLSQAYARKLGIFHTAPWMKILIREVNDPFSYKTFGSSGGINIIDLANVDSCAFIETEDIGKMVDTCSFEVLGRMDNTELRGCNLLSF